MGSNNSVYVRSFPVTVTVPARGIRFYSSPLMRSLFGQLLGGDPTCKPSRLGFCEWRA